jgi:sterol desaturase/sphingolipid hydroxylase (fatty acid hydroxylase superfamily)
LRHVLVSPDFHRHHHAAHVPPANYAGMFSLWDRLFGTFHEPDVSATLRFGLGASSGGARDTEHWAPTFRAHFVAPIVRLLRGPG